MSNHFEDSGVARDPKGAPGVPGAPAHLAPGSRTRSFRAPDVTGGRRGVEGTRSGLGRAAAGGASFGSPPGGGGGLATNIDRCESPPAPNQTVTVPDWKIILAEGVVGSDSATKGASPA
jgi:hypothetical protein